MYFGSPIHAKEIHSSVFEGCGNTRFMKRIYVLPSSPAARNCANRVARHCPVALHATVSRTAFESFVLRLCMCVSILYFMWDRNKVAALIKTMQTRRGWTARSAAPPGIFHSSSIFEVHIAIYIHNRLGFNKPAHETSYGKRSGNIQGGAWLAKCISYPWVGDKMHSSWQVPNRVECISSLWIWHQKCISGTGGNYPPMELSIRKSWNHAISGGCVPRTIPLRGICPGA